LPCCCCQPYRKEFTFVPSKKETERQCRNKSATPRILSPISMSQKDTDNMQMPSPRKERDAVVSEEVTPLSHWKSDKRKLCIDFDALQKLLDGDRT